MTDDGLVLQGEDGKTYGFPAGTPKEKVAAYFTKLGVKPVKRISGDYGGGSTEKAPLQSSHAKEPIFPGFAAAHEKAPGMQFGPAQGSVPSIDPLTGRQQTKGRTMTEEETARYRTGAITVAGATAGSLVAAPVVAPVLAFSRAGIAETFAIQAMARMFGATLGGAGGEAYGQLFEHAHGVGPSSSGVAAERIGRSAADMAELEAIGLGTEGAFKLVAEGAKAGTSRAYEALKKTRVYAKMVAEKAAAVTERNLAVTKTAAETAESVVNDFASMPVPGVLENRGPGIVAAVEAKVSENVNKMYEGFKKAVADKHIDYRDVADMVVAIEKKTPRAKGGLKVMTEPPPEWTTFVKSMKEGNEVSEVGRVPNSAEPAPAVVDARGTISQRIADLKRTGHPPKEYVEGLEKTLAALDEKLMAVAAEVGPGGPELLTAAKRYYGASEKIKEQAMYRLMKNGGDVAGALMDPARPEGVSVLKAVARETRDTTILPTAQRAVIEKLLNPSGKGVDLTRFNDRLRALGLTGENLFSDPRAARVIAGIKEQAEVFQHLETVPRITGEPAESLVTTLLTHTAGSVLGYQIGRDITGSFHGGWAGAVVGGMGANRMVGYLLRLAENPQANRLFLNALKLTEKTGEVSGVAIAQAGRALKMVNATKLLRDNISQAVGIGKQEAPNAAPQR